MVTLTAPYSRPEDMLFGDMMVGPNVDKQSYVDSAGREINSRLGYVYALPLTGEIQQRSIDHLNKINNFIASGRLIMALAASGELAQVHQYGKSLLEEGMAELGAILSGAMDIDGAERLTTLSEARTPILKNRDEVSAVEAFEDNFYGQDGCAIWRPGAA